MKKFISILIISTQLFACATYENRAVSFRPPEDYVNYHDVTGLKVGAEAYADQKQAEDAFGFDVRTAGLLPVQVVIDNQSGQRAQIVMGQTFLIDDSNRYWTILATKEAVDRVQDATQAGAIGGGAGKGAMYGAAVGSILGLALGIVSGHNAGEALVKGGVLGAAGGAVIGGTSKAGEDQQREYTIAEDVRSKGVEGKIIPSESLASGFIFFPGEAKSAKELRLQIKFIESGRIQTLNLKFK